MTPVDSIAHANRWRARAVEEKALAALGMLALTIALPAFPTAPLVATTMTLATLAGAGVPARVWLGLAAAPLGFVVAGALPLLVVVGAEGVAWSADGPAAAAALIARALAGVSCLLFLALTTPAGDLVAGSRRLGVPVEVVEVAWLTYRFVFLLAETAAAMNAAQGARLGHDGWGRRARSAGLVAAQLLPRALARARRLEIGLAARGWRGELTVLSPKRPVSRAALAAILAVEAAIGGMGLAWGSLA